MKIAILLILLAGLTCSLRMTQTGLNHNDQTTLVGGFSTIDVNNLNDFQKQIDQFIRSNFPELQSYKIVKAQSQVVQGWNYIYVYGKDGSDSKIQFSVWDRPWLKSRKLMSAKRIDGKDNSKSKTIQSRDGEYVQAIRDLFKD